MSIDDEISLDIRGPHLHDDAGEVKKIMIVGDPIALEYEDERFGPRRSVTTSAALAEIVAWAQSQCEMVEEWPDLDGA